MTEVRHLNIYDSANRTPWAVERWLQDLPGRLVAGPAVWPFDQRSLYAVTVEDSR